jgi:hypothetical protein
MLDHGDGKLTGKRDQSCTRDAQQHDHKHLKSTIDHTATKT